MKQYKIVKNFSENNIGDVIFLNDRRAKSELRNGNVVEFVAEKPKEKKIEVKEQKYAIKTKEHKATKKTK